MTAKERQRLQRMVAENRMLRAELDRLQDVNRRMLYEIVDLKARLELVRSAIEGDPHGG